MPVTDMSFPGIREVYLNGEYFSPGQAAVSPFDRGFIFGDGIYEVIAAYGGHPFRLQQHLDRLARNLSAVRIEAPLADDQWQAIFERLLSHQPGTDQYIYVQVTRGVAPRNHAYPADAHPTAFAYASDMPVIEQAARDAGVKAILRPDIRWTRCDLKTTSLIAAAWLKQEATEEGAEEAILVRDGWVTEGASSNVFVVTKGQILTPPNGQSLLPGVTRNLLVELLRSGGLDVAETECTDRQLLGADEVWVSSTIREVLPVVQVDDDLIGQGRPGPMYRKADKILQDYKNTLRQGRG